MSFHEIPWLTCCGPCTRKLIVARRRDEGGPKAAGARADDDAAQCHDAGEDPRGHRTGVEQAPEHAVD